jgi:Bacteriophage head to tail connecting protein
MEMGVDLLSQQPAVAPETLLQDAEWWITVFTYLEKRLGVLRTWRYSWWAYWNRLAEYFLPRRHKWVVTANTLSRGSPINDRIIDSTGTLAMQTCASGMWTGLTSPSRPWFKLDKGLPWVELDADGKEWLEDTEQRVYTVLGQSNFYTTMAQAFQDVVVFGTAPVIIYEDFYDGIRCYLPCAGEYFLAVGSRLSNDTLYREFTFTVEQIVGFATLEKCPPEIQKHWTDGSLDLEYVVAHAIEPNFKIAKKGARTATVSVVPGIFPYREVYWLKGIKTAEPLSRRGFRIKPFMSARWSTVSNDPYGRSPCMDALGDDKQLQLETVRKAEFIEKGVRPPMGANPELKNEPNSILPGHTTYMSTDGGKKGFWPLFEINPAWLTGITADIKEVQARIQRCLFVDLFMAISRMEGVQPRNELELTKRDLERLQELGPFIELFETEFAGPAIMRVLEIMENRKMLKAKPQSLRGVPLKINYMSIMKLAQRSAESVAMKDVFATMGELSSAAKAAEVPDPIRVFDLDKAARKYADITNFPAECLFTEGEVQQHDQARQQGSQQAQAPQAAMAAVTAAKTLSDTKLSPGSALSALTGGAGAPQ